MLNKLSNEIVEITLTNGDIIEGFKVAEKKLEDDSFIELATATTETHINTKNIKKTTTIDPQFEFRDEIALLISKGAYQSCINKIKALESHTVQYDLLNNLGICLVHLGNVAEANKYFKLAIIEDPISHEALTNISNLYKLEKENLIAGFYSDAASITENLKLSNMILTDDEFIKNQHLMLEIYLPFIKHGNAEQRELAALRVNFIKNVDLLNALIDALSKNVIENSKFKNIAFAIGNMCEDIATDTLITALMSHEKEKQSSGRAVAQALGKIGNKKALPFLVEKLQNSDVDDLYKNDIEHAIFLIEHN